jgi:hypothetical protein
LPGFPDRRCDLNSHKVVWIVDPTTAGLIFCVEPIRPDDCEKDIARSHMGVQTIHEVDAGGNVVDVHEQAVGSKRIGKSIAQPPGRAGGILDDS